MNWDTWVGILVPVCLALVGAVFRWAMGVSSNVRKIELHAASATAHMAAQAERNERHEQSLKTLSEQHDKHAQECSRKHELHSKTAGLANSRIGIVETKVENLINPPRLRPVE